MRDLEMRRVGAHQEKPSCAVACGWYMWHVSCGIEPLSGVWRCVQSPMESRLPLMCRSGQDNLNGIFTNVIRAIFAVVMQRAVACAV